MTIHNAKPKINLMLHVTECLPSGFHHLQSLITFMGDGDQIKVQESDTFSLDINGPFGALLPIKDNLVLSAAEWIHGLYNSKKKAHITLTKNLPISSGIGGGSSDAATVIAALIDMWELILKDTDKKELIKKSGVLGADVPVCLAHHLLGKSYFWIDGSGKEGMPEPLWTEDPLAEYSILLVNPKIAVSTPDVFRLYDGVYDKAVAGPLLSSLDLTLSSSGLTLSSWDLFRGSKDSCTKCENDNMDQESSLMDFLMHTNNSLTKPASELVPEIGKILDVMNSSDDCLLARMSGSGATCFGVYKNDQACTEAALKMDSNWWVCKV